MRKLYFLLLIILPFALFNCKKDDKIEEKEQLPIETLSASNVLEFSAVIQGRINAVGVTFNQVGFMYGTSENLLNQIVIAENDGDQFSAELNNLDEETSYFFRAFGISADGATAKLLAEKTMSFTTVPTPPEVYLYSSRLKPDSEESEDFDLYATKVRLRIDIEKGKLPITKIAIKYGHSPEDMNQEISIKNLPDNYSEKLEYWLENLKENTTYFVSVSVTDEAGTVVESEAGWNSTNNHIEFTTRTIAPSFWTIKEYYSYQYDVIWIGEKPYESWGIIYGTDSNNLDQTLEGEYIEYSYSNPKFGFTRCNFPEEVSGIIYAKQYKKCTDGSFEYADEITTLEISRK